MTVQDRTIVAQRAPLSEMFAALSGLTLVGISASKLNLIGPPDMVLLGSRAVITSYDAKMAANEGKHDKAVALVLKTLRDSRELLEIYRPLELRSLKGALGGTSEDVLKHIIGILDREDNGFGNRTLEKFPTVGKATKKFSAPYLP